jgi:integrase
VRASIRLSRRAAGQITGEWYQRLRVPATAKPFTSNGFGNWFGDQCRAAGLPHCSAHGLRKARAVHYAHRGASTAQLKARFGWSTDSMAAKYIKTANQEHLADMIEELPARRQPVPTGGN